MQQCQQHCRNSARQHSAAGPVASPQQGQQHAENTRAPGRVVGLAGFWALAVGQAGQVEGAQAHAVALHQLAAVAALAAEPAVPVHLGVHTHMT